MGEHPSVPRRALGKQGLVTSAQGLGCMGMSAFYGNVKPEEEMIKTILHAVHVGITFFDTSDIYGPFTNEVLLGKALAPIRDKVEIATKFGIFVDPQTKSFRLNGSPEYVRSACEASLKRLQTDYIDLYYMHRMDPTIPIEITVGAMKELVKEGKVKYIGLSEVSADTIRRAHAVHPITAIQLEWSLWTREVEAEIVPLCRELGIGIVPYSPLGRGFFSGKFTEEKIAEGDFRAAHPRFNEQNRAFYERLKKIAGEKGFKPGQLALAWVHHQGEDVFPIPGTTSIHHLDDNVAAIGMSLSKEEIEEIAAAVPKSEISGERYAETQMASTWETQVSPPLDAYLSSLHPTDGGASTTS